ncbi:helix-turn-helix domain-containing protein [Streptomyces montanisoli]|uniref:Helix-turn-helix domain-containing protein n=1 Tax=Streptomyces montanisoli TaxID=2798581 RepID=A0A940ME78_9ACTN|nr:helix-turn-helix domain-containing protein [Streptomyces montanisoli]MBP0459253.1 helix-turn-helix domain-containing protein [Streptomyces montanisoli]
MAARSKGAPVSIGNSSDGSSPEDDPNAPHPASEDRVPIGLALRRARVAAGLTIEGVSAATRVRAPIVHAIENDDFTRSGGDVYARGHIRMIAHEVGLDPGPLVEQFDAEHGGRPAPTATPAAPLFEAERIRPERRRPNWTAAMVAAIVAVAGFVGFTAFHSSGSDGSSKNTAGTEAGGPSASASSPSPTHSKKKTPPAPAASDSAIAAAPRDKVTVKLSAVDAKSWISAKAHNGKLLFDGILDKGQSKTFQDDKRVDLILGNAGAIELYVNGKKVDDQFRSGQVERLSYTQGDPSVG